jgi:hypothetical protein
MDEADSIFGEYGLGSVSDIQRVWGDKQQQRFRMTRPRWRFREPLTFGRSGQVYLGNVMKTVPKVYLWQDRRLLRALAYPPGLGDDHAARPAATLPCAQPCRGHKGLGMLSVSTSAPLRPEPFPCSKAELGLTPSR